MCFLHLEVALADFEDAQRAEAAKVREENDPTLNDDMSRKTPGAGSSAKKPKKGAPAGPPKIQALTEPQKIRDEIKILCKTLHSIPAVRGLSSHSPYCTRLCRVCVVRLPPSLTRCSHCSLRFILQKTKPSTFMRMFRRF